MLRDALDSLGGFFSRSFLLGCFLPAFIVLALNLVLATIGLKAWGAITFTGQAYSIPNLATAVSVGALGSVSLAFIAAPFVPLMQRLVEGAMLPPPLRARFIAAGEETARKLQAIATHWATAHLSLSQTIDVNERALIASRAIGQAVTGRPKAPSIDAAVKAVRDLKQQLESPSRRGAKDFSPGGEVAVLIQSAFAALELALAENRSSTDPAKRRDTDFLCQKLDDAHLKFGQLCEETLRRVVVSLATAQYALTSQFAQDDIRATRFGNYRAVMEAYPARAYGVTFDYISPRLDLVMTASSGIFDGFDRAKTQVDSAVMLLMLTALSLAGWLVGLVIEGRHFWLFLGIAAITPLLLRLMYELVVESQKAFAERAQAAIDGSRFSLLTALHMASPADSDAERAAWKALQGLSAGFRGAPVAFVAPPAGVGAGAAGKS